jgi:hypothetical protein
MMRAALEHVPSTGNRGRLGLWLRSDRRWRIAIAVDRDPAHRSARRLQRRARRRISPRERWQTSLREEPKLSRSHRQPRTAKANTDPNGRDRVRHNLTSRHLSLYLI